jgi:hypothetical protein
MKRTSLVKTCRRNRTIAFVDLHDLTRGLDIEVGRELDAEREDGHQ